MRRCSARSGAPAIRSPAPLIWVRCSSASLASASSCSVRQVTAPPSSIAGERRSPGGSSRSTASPPSRSRVTGRTATRSTASSAATRAPQPTPAARSRRSAAGPRGCGRTRRSSRLSPGSNGGTSERPRASASAFTASMCTACGIRCGWRCATSSATTQAPPRLHAPPIAASSRIGTSRMPMRGPSRLSASAVRSRWCGS